MNTTFDASLARLILTLLLSLFAPLALDAGTPPNHLWNLSGPNPPYGLTQEFPAQKYEHSRWGVLMSEGTGTPTLPYTGLTTFADELFLDRGGILTIEADENIDAVATRDTANQRIVINDTGLVVTPPPQFALLRKLHFHHDGTTYGLERIGGGSMDGNSRKAIILIHGWNPNSDDNSYAEPGDDALFVALKDNLQAAIASSPDWQLFVYHWEKDADTGPLLDWHLTGFVHATRAAESGHLHGQYLGELIEALSDQKLEKVHFIAHSAGTWAARGATKYLLQSRAGASVPIKTQITLLDPFIPSEVIGIDTSLSKTVIDGLDSMPGANADTLFRLENYYSNDISGPTTEQVFSWRSVDENGLEVGGGAFRTLGFDPYGGPDGHSGPIQYYADTVRASSGQTGETDAFDRLSRAGLVDESSLSFWGWRRSIFYNEPVVTPRNPTVTETTGGGKTLTGNARRRGAQAATTGIQFRWEVSTTGADGSWTAFEGMAFGSSPILALTSAQVNAARRFFRLVAKTDAGFDTGNAVEVVPNTPTGGSALAAPANLTATAVSTSRIDLKWLDKSNNETGFRLQRRTAGGVFADIPTAAPANSQAFSNTLGLSAGTTYFYRIRAFNSTDDSDWSAEASAITFAPAGTSFTLAIASSNPASGISVWAVIGSSTSATYTTPASPSFASGTAVWFTCASSLPGGLVFQKWQLDGSDYSFSTDITVTMNSAHTLTVVYGAAPLPARVLSSLTIEGPSSLDERNSAQYRARAAYTDGSSAYVDASAVWTDDSSYASISATGMLDSSAVSSDRDIVIEAMFTAGGVTKTATRDVTIYNTDAVPTFTLTRNVVGSGDIGNGPSGSSFAAGTSVFLHANEGDGYVFDHWSGDVSGTEDDVYIVMDRNKTVTAHFVVDTSIGNIRVDISPPQAVVEGAQWKYDLFTAWQNSGYLMDGITPRINRSVHFKDIPGWITPDNTKASIIGGQTTVTSAVYREVPGTVQATISPDQARDAGARWRLDGGSWLSSGTSIGEVLPGNHQIEFQAVSGWSTPAAQQITVQRGGTSMALGKYEPPPGLPLITAVSPKTGPIEGGTLLTIEGANFTANANVLIGGRAASEVTFFTSTKLTARTPTSPVFGSAEVEVNTGTSSAADANAFAYGIPRGTNMTLITSSGGLYQAVACNNQYLLIGQGTSLSIYDISTPSSPVFRGSVAVPGLIQDIALSGSFAFVAANDAGVQVVDISNVSAPILRGFYRTTGFAYAVEVLAGRAYVVDRANGLVILDVTNPDGLVALSSLALDSFNWDIALKASAAGFHAYVATRGKLYVVDISDPSTPVKLTEIAVSGRDYWSIALAGNLAFLGSIGGGVGAVDISDPAHPVNVGPLFGTSYVTVTSVGNRVVLGGWSQSFDIADVSGTTVTLRGSLSNGDVTFTSNAGQRMAISDGKVWIAAETAVFGVNISNPDAPQRIFKKDDQGGRCEKVASLGSVVAAGTLGGLFGYNYSGNALTLTAKLSARGGNSMSLYFYDNILFDNVFDRFQLLPNGSFTPLTSLTIPNVLPDDAYLNGTRLLSDGQTFPGDGHAVITEHDLSGSNWILRQKHLSFIGSGVQIAGFQDVFFLARFDSPSGKWNLESYSWNASTPSWQVSGLESINALQLSHNNRFLHVGENFKYRIYDLLDPGNPVCLSTNATANGIHDILIDGDEAYLAAYGQGVLVYDIADKSHPHLKRSYDTPGSAFSLVKLGNRLVVADYTGGIQVLGLPDILPPQIFITAPVAQPQFQTTSSPIVLGGGAEDDSGQISRLTWSNDRGGGGTAQGTTDWLVSEVFLQPGPNVLTVTAFDAEGNAGTDQITIDFTPPDTTPPAVTIMGPKPDDEFVVPTGAITLSGSAVDNQSIATLTWSNNRGGSGTIEFTGQNWSLINLPLELGPNLIQVTATDSSGNIGSDTAVIFVVTADANTPNVSIEFPTLNAVYATGSPLLNLSGMADDNVRVNEIRWTSNHGGQGLANGIAPWSVNDIPLQPGLNVIEVTVIDDAGNSSSDTLSVMFIEAMPELSIVRADGNVVLLWPTNAAGFLLESATSVPTVNWTLESTIPSIVNDQFTVTNAITGDMRFYRLKK